MAADGAMQALEGNEMRSVISNSLATGLLKMLIDNSGAQWLIRKGMGYGDRDTWWNNKSRLDAHNEEKHLGIDLAAYVGLDGRIRTVRPGTAVPVMLSGKVKWVSEDNMQSTVAVQNAFGETVEIF